MANDQASAAQQLAAQRAQDNMNFLANSFTTQKAMLSPGGTAFAAGQQLTYTVPVMPGWAEKLRIFFNLTVTATLAGGTVVVNAGAPWNIFQNIAVDFNGQNHRSTSGYWYKVLQQIIRGRLDIADSKLDSITTLCETLVAPASTLSAGANTWIGYIDIPLQLDPNDTAGMVPLGDSATPLTLRVTPASTFVGSDPLLNPVSVTGGATVAVAGTVSAVCYYRYAQSVHSPQIKPAAPYIGSFAKMLETTTSIGQTGTPVVTLLTQPYPHLRVLQAVVVPNSATVFSDITQVSSLKFDLDPMITLKDYSAQGGTVPGKLIDQRELYHGDLDAGIFVWDFIAGSNPEQPNGLNTPNIAQYNASQTEVVYGGGLAANNNRIMTVAMFLESLPF